MKTEIIKKELKQAVDVLKKGGTVIYPTETAYGLGADALNMKAIKKVYEVKQRPLEKNLTVIVDSLEMAEEYAVLTTSEISIIKKLMPGPITLISKKRESVWMWQQRMDPWAIMA